MRCPAVLAIFMAASLASCGMILGPNVIPIRNIELASVNPDADQKRVEELAETLGFSRRMGALRDSNVPVTHAGVQPARQLSFWYWPEHPATVFGLLKILSKDSLMISFADDQGGGWALTGPSCAKYLELAAALRARFEAERLTFQRDSCQE